MSEPPSLLEFLQGLLTDDEMRDGFLADPHRTLADHGLAHLSPADVHDALVLVEDTQTADYGHGATVMPLAPPPDGHTDTVGYLRGYLSGGDADDLAFGAGDVGYAAIPAPREAEPDVTHYESAFDLAEAGADNEFGASASGAGQDEYADLYDEVEYLPAEHHDVDI
jgi:hypothetical protein